MRLALTLSMLAFANLGLGALQQWYVLLLVGPGDQTDALFAATTVPSLILSIIGGPFTYILIPLLASKEPQELWRHTRLFFALIGSVFLGASGILWIFAPQWFPATVPGLAESVKILGIELARIQLTGMIFVALHGVLWSALHAQQRLILADLSPVVAAGASCVLLIWVLPRFGVVGAAWVGVARYGFQLAILLPRLGRFARSDWDILALREAWRRLRPLLLGTIYYKSDPLVDRFLSSMTPPGGLSLLFLGQQLIASSSQVINSAVAAPMVPQLAVRAHHSDWANFRGLYRSRLLRVTLLIVPCYVLFALVGLPVLRLVASAGGAVPEQSVRLLWNVMVCLAGVLVGGVYGQILSTAFYALGITSTPTIIGAAGFSVGVVLKIVGFLNFGLLGIALGTTIYYLLNALALYIFLERQLAGALLDDQRSLIA